MLTRTLAEQEGGAVVLARGSYLVLQIQDILKTQRKERQFHDHKSTTDALSRVPNEASPCCLFFMIL